MAVHGGALCARAVCCVVMRCTVSYSGVPVPTGWCTAWCGGLLTA